MRRAADADGAPISVRRREPGTARPRRAPRWPSPCRSCPGDVIGAIDADTRVEPAFLERAMRGVARVTRRRMRSRWRAGRATRRVSWLTRAQAEEQLMDMASQCGRWATDGTAELRGNGMFVRRAALEAVGGWRDRALTEDLELSTRLSAYGRHVTLAPEAEVREEAVEALGDALAPAAALGGGQPATLARARPGLLAGSQPMSRKADFLAFTGEFLIPPLFVATIVASLVTIPLPRPADWTVPVSLFVGYGLGVFLLALGGLWRDRRARRSAPRAGNPRRALPVALAAWSCRSRCCASPSGGGPAGSSRRRGPPAGTTP